MAKADFDYAPTSPGTPATGPQIHLLDTQADGYCEPATGMCVLPGATTVEKTDRLADETTVTDTP